jgi:hypothetical protein
MGIGCFKPVRSQKSDRFKSFSQRRIDDIELRNFRHSRKMGIHVFQSSVDSHLHENIDFRIER